MSSSASIPKTLETFRPVFETPKRNWQGRSKKQLRASVKYRGGIFVARFEGRPNIFFGNTEKEVLNNMKGEL